MEHLCHSHDDPRRRQSSRSERRRLSARQSGVLGDRPDHAPNAEPAAEARRRLLEFILKESELDDVRRRVPSVPRVGDVHDLHASMVSTSLPVATVDFVVNDSCLLDGPSYR